MPPQGRTVRVSRWIHSPRIVVRVEVDALIPDEDPSEPCLTPETVRWLDEVQRLADAGDIAALERLGEVYLRKSA